MVTLPNYKQKHQRLYLTKLPKKNEYIMETFCGMALDCFNEGDEEGTLVVQWSINGKSHQVWIF
jgi:hypothetical protein